MSDEGTDFDGAWKEALELYFEEFLAFFFPNAYAGIDWSRGFHFLDTELQEIMRESELEGCRADKLVQVWRTTGEEVWVLIHIEIQSQRDPRFAERMYIYNYRIFDRFHKTVVSLAVLSDDQAGWRPDRYVSELWGCEVSLRFPTVKLLDLGKDWDALEANRNPFAIITMAHLKAQAARKDDQARFVSKLAIIKSLMRRGYSRREIVKLFDVIDWLLYLPEPFKQSLIIEVRKLQEDVTMPFVNCFNEHYTAIGREQGIEAGKRDAILAVLSVRFNATSETLAQRLSAAPKDRLDKFLAAAATAASLEEFEQILDKKD